VLLVRAATRQSSLAAMTSRAEPTGWADGLPPEVSRDTTVELKGEAPWQWAAIQIPLPQPLPPSVRVGIRAAPQRTAPPAADRMARFEDLADPLGSAPEAFRWFATPENKQVLLAAWRQIQQGFQVRGQWVLCNLPVTGPGDPRIPHAVGVLWSMARALRIPGPMQIQERPPSPAHAPVGSSPAPPPAPAASPAPAPTASPTPSGPSTAQPVPSMARVTPAKREPPQLQEAWQSTARQEVNPTKGLAEPRPQIDPKGGLAEPRPQIDPAGGLADRPQVGQPPATCADPAQWLAATSLGTPSSAGSWPSSSPRHPASTASPLPSASQPKVEAASRPPPAPRVQDAGLSDASALLAHLLDAADAAAPGHPSGDLNDTLLPTGRVYGHGKVSLCTPLYGRDLDLGVSTGVRLTVEVPLPRHPLLSPRVVVHLPEPPEQPLRSGEAVEFSGDPVGFKPFARTLLLGNGLVERQT